MIRSIRQFLFTSLLITITLASSFTAVGNYLLDDQVIQPYLDTELKELADFIINLSTAINLHSSKHIQNQISAQSKNAAIPPTNDLTIQTNQKLQFAVHDLQGHLLMHSPGTPRDLFNVSALGFSDHEVNHGNWRTYTTHDNASGLTVTVGELFPLRNKLADDITRNNIYILVITYPILGIFIWIINGIALRSITQVTNEISNRASTYLEPVHSSTVPIEIKPLVDELNDLFTRLQSAFERNKRFAADAAHELRTPLAALKTQAQVALKAENPGEIKNALLKVVQGVDRSSHVITQLLILSRLTQETTLNDIHEVDLHKLAADIIAYLVPIALEKNIEIELAADPSNPLILGNDTSLGILIRNVVDNAIRYTPRGGHVKVEILNAPSQVIFRVTDSGPGIPVELRERVFERFFRILDSAAPGSGLGLAIVSQIAELHHAQISLHTPPNSKGLQFDVAFPKLENK